MTYTCPVCAYDQMDQPPSGWNICSCCGTEFEYDDASRTHEELRRDWVQNGAKWFSEYDMPVMDEIVWVSEDTDRDANPFLAAVFESRYQDQLLVSTDTPTRCSLYQAGLSYEGPNTYYRREQRAKR